MNNLDNIGQTFQWAGQRYMAIMQPFAEKIFFGLVVIEIVITCVHFLTDQEEPTRLLAEFVKKSLALGFLYAMIVNAPMWFSAIIQGFQEIVFQDRLHQIICCAEAKSLFFFLEDAAHDDRNVVGVSTILEIL